MERLAALKEYRTPQAFRAFARIYIQFLGVLYGPYYCYLGGAGTDRSSLAFALAYACATQVLIHLSTQS